MDRPTTDSRFDFRLRAAMAFFLVWALATAALVAAGIGEPAQGGTSREAGSAHPHAIGAAVR